MKDKHNGLRTIPDGRAIKLGYQIMAPAEKAIVEILGQNN
jgi:hypothetical protein